MNADPWPVLSIQNVHLKLSGASLPPNISLMFPHTARVHTAYLSPEEPASERIREMEVLLLLWQIFFALPNSPLLCLHHVLGPKEGKIWGDKALRVTSDGSWTHWPSTKNLYWCSPSGRSRIATKSLWLCRENRDTTPFTAVMLCLSMGSQRTALCHALTAPWTQTPMYWVRAAHHSRHGQSRCECPEPQHDSDPSGSIQS